MIPIFSLREKRAPSTFSQSEKGTLLRSKKGFAKSKKRVQPKAEKTLVCFSNYLANYCPNQLVMEHNT